MHAGFFCKSGKLPSMKIQILTLFPGICDSILSESIMGRARRSGAVEIEAMDLRQWAEGRHRVTDDAPYGGGPGMVMKVEPVFAALSALRQPATRVVLLSPQGRRFDQKSAEGLAACEHLILLCGHYEGIDQRVADHLVDEEFSIGDYVLTNGALAACVVADAVVRLLPGVLGDAGSAREDSFSSGLLDHPHYTRPEVFQGWAVPSVLLSGDHAAIAAWRKTEALRLTRERRPDLLPKEESLAS
jgi:tRNA (guanine37-N1)-methyltransferase